MKKLIAFLFIGITNSIHAQTNCIFTFPEPQYYLYGFIDKEGNEISPIKYDSVGFFKEGLAAISINGKWGFIDKTGKEVIAIKYDNVERFQDGVVAVRLNYKYSIIDTAGKKIHFFQNNYWAGTFNGDLANVTPTIDYTIRKTTREEIAALKYDWNRKFKEAFETIKINIFRHNRKYCVEILPYRYDKNPVPVKLNGKWRILDRTGKEIISSLEYDEVGKFGEGLARVELNGKFGFIDTIGKEAVPLKYDWARNFNEGLAVVRLNEKSGFIDKTGKEVIALKYDDVDPVFNEGFAVVKMLIK